MAERKLPIYSLEDVTKFLRVPEIANKIGGYSTFSLELIKSGQESFSIPTYGPESNQIVNIDLHHDLFEQLFGKITVRHPSNSFPGSLVRNRDFGFIWSVFELYRETVKKDATFEEIDDLYLDVNLGSFLEAFEYSALRTVKGLVASSEVLQNSVYDQAEMVRKYFRFDKSFIRLLEKTKTRGGVQVLYGDKESLAKFISDPQSQAEEIGDISVRVSRPIPGNLVLGLVPLGEYEKKALISR